MNPVLELVLFPFAVLHQLAVAIFWLALALVILMIAALYYRRQG